MDPFELLACWRERFGGRQVTPHEAAGLLGTRDVLLAQRELMALAGREIDGWWLAVHDGGDGWPRFGLRGPRRALERTPV